MKTKTYSYRGRLYSEIPKDVADSLKIKSGDEIEFRQVYDNLILVLPSHEQKEEGPKEEGIELLRKIGTIRHYDRTYDNIARAISAAERKVFDELFKGGALFRYKKAGKELVGVDKKYFKYIVGEKNELVEKLMKDGCIVLDDQAKAKELNDMLKKEKLAVRGIRGFDKRYYIMSADKLSDIEDRLEKMLTKEKTIKTISAELGFSEDLCQAAIEILREDGKIIEKRKNSYVLA